MIARPDLFPLPASGGSPISHTATGLSALSWFGMIGKLMRAQADAVGGGRGSCYGGWGGITGACSIARPKREGTPERPERQSSRIAGRYENRGNL